MPLHAELKFEELGFAHFERVVTGESLERLARALDAPAPEHARRQGGWRGLLETAAVRGVLAEPGLIALARSLAGPSAFIVRALLFDKRPGTNWKVRWHQDLTVAVERRVEAAGFGPWTVKQGVPHVIAPAAVLERMLALRLHLDPCGADNGPLLVLPRSHQTGRLSEDAITALRETGEAQACLAQAGDVLAMRPLLLHASAPALKPGRRRVLHLELANAELPAGLAWRWRMAS